MPKLNRCWNNFNQILTLHIDADNKLLREKFCFDWKKNWILIQVLDLDCMEYFHENSHVNCKYYKFFF